MQPSLFQGGQATAAAKGKRTQRGICAASKAVKTLEPPERKAYAPLESVWEGEDSDLLEKLLIYYPRTQPQWILDSTSKLQSKFLAAGWQDKWTDVRPPIHEG